MLKKIILFILFLNLNKIYSGSKKIKLNKNGYMYNNKLNENLQEEDIAKTQSNDKNDIKKQIVEVFGEKKYTINKEDITLEKKSGEEEYWSCTINNLLITDIMKEIKDKKEKINSSESDDIADFNDYLEKNLKGNMFYSNYYDELEKYIDFLKKCKEASHDINEEDINNFKDFYSKDKDDLFIENIFKKFFNEYVFMDEEDIKKLKNELKKEFEDKFNKKFNKILTKVNINIKDNNVLKDDYKKKFENIQNKYKRGTFEFLSYCIILEKLRKSFEQANIKLYNKINGNFQLIKTDDNNDLFLKRGNKYEIYVEFPYDFYKTIYHDKSVGTNDEKKGIGGNIDYLDEDDEEIKHTEKNGRCRCLRNCLKKNR